MKKLLVVALGIMMTFSLVACGDTNKTSSSDDTKETVSDGADETENESEGADSDITEMTVESGMSGNYYDITFKCPANGVVITELPEVSEDGSEEVTPEDQKILDVYESVKPLYVDAPMLVCDEYVMTWGCDWYSYPYDATDMEDYFNKLEENGVKGLELTEINGQKAILQDYDSMYIVRVATEDPSMYVEFKFIPNDTDALEKAEGNTIASPYIEVAREFIESDLLKTAYEGIQIKQK